MKGKLLMRLFCFSGIVFMSLPAWSFVAPTIYKDADDWSQLCSSTGDNLLKSTLIIAKGGGNGGSGGGGGNGGSGGGGGNGGNGQGINTQSQHQEQTQTKTQLKDQVQDQTQTQTKTQLKDQE